MADEGRTKENFCFRRRIENDVQRRGIQQKLKRLLPEEGQFYLVRIIYPKPRVYENFRTCIIHRKWRRSWQSAKETI